MLGLVLRLCLSALVFYYGYLMGRLLPSSSAVPEKCTQQPLPPTPPLVQQMPPPLPCPDEPASIATSATASSSSSGSSTPSPGVHNHCTSPPSAERLFLHIAPATIHKDLFPHLHHPDTPAKQAFVMTQGQPWPDRRPVETACKEVYLTRTGQRQSQPNKCVAVVKVPVGVASGVQSSHRYGYTALLTNQYRNDYPTTDTMQEETVLLPPLLKELPALQKVFKGKMGEPIGPDGQRRAVVVMVANEGVMDLVLNFLCSAEDVGLDLKTVVVFVGSPQDAVLVENMGAQALYSTALGSMPAKAAAAYLDHTFSRMMWFKTTSIFLATSCGFDALFQDVDLVWTQNPLGYLQGLDADISFMDDGARTPRYTPFFVNSGFYFVKYNPRTLYFQEKMMKTSASEIGRTHSHQSVLIRHLAESHHLAGLKVHVLEMDLFPSGHAYHERKKFLQKIIERTYAPYVFHMCWTDNKVNKIVYFKDSKLWYLPEADVSPVCTDGKHLNTYAAGAGAGGRSARDMCCQRQRYWWHNATAAGGKTQR